MKEEYVTYEQAVKLKELGFDWEVNKVYHRPSTLAEWELFPWHSGYNDWNNEGKFYISAPTLSLAQKWLREVKRIIVEPHFQYESVFRFVVQSESRCIYKLFDERCKTYELALSAGIDKALEILTDKLNNDNKTI